MHLVSIVTPIYNCSEFLELTIRSVLSQTYQNWEMIMVDDCSRDDSLDIAQRYEQKDQRIKVMQLEKSSGAAVARNTAIAAAQGRYIAFLDSDDLWFPQKLEQQISFMLIHNVSFSYTAYEKIDESGSVFGLMGVPQKVSYRELLKTCVIGCLTAVYDTESLGKIYMPTNTKREDFATWLNILKKVDCAYGLTEALAQYRVYANQISSKKASMAKENWRLYRDLEKLGLWRSSYYFINYAVRGVLRTKFPRLARALGFLQ
jgi:glycosyltransferase involved in cell wall biosynthesis